MWAFEDEHSLLYPILRFESEWESEGQKIKAHSARTSTFTLSLNSLLDHLRTFFLSFFGLPLHLQTGVWSFVRLNKRMPKAAERSGAAFGNPS